MLDTDLKEHKLFPSIKKVSRITGKHIYLRNVTISDAEFILSLRLDSKRAKFFLNRSSKLEDQIVWLEKYSTCSDQAYFIICDKNDNRLGCIRMYDPQQFSYTWGSWLIIDAQPFYVSIESVLLIYSYGRELGFEEARIDVNKKNKSVWHFHEKFCHAERISETDSAYYYLMNKNAIDTLLAKYKKLYCL